MIVNSSSPNMLPIMGVSKSIHNKCGSGLLKYLKSNYNQHIVHLVKELTEKDKSWDTPEQEKATWKERKLDEMEKVSKFSPNELALKLGL